MTSDDNHGDGMLNKGMLNGVRILDFTRLLAGPYATRILADFGAEVIKVQSKKIAKGAESNIGGYFSTWNRNKRSITLNMDHPEAREIALKLTAISDIVIDNFSPRVMSNWGLGYERLRTVKSDLIMIEMSGMGQTGPWKNFVAFGPTLQALGGLTYLTSYDTVSPMGPGYAHADHVAGLYGALAALAALAYRDRTGLGRYINLSEYEAVCTLIGPALLDVIGNQNNPVPQGNRPANIPAAPYGCYRCQGKDRWCVIAVFDDTQWQALCHIIDRPDWAEEERFSGVVERKGHMEEMDRGIGQWTSRHKAETVVSLLQGAGIPAGVVQNAQDLANDPQLKARDFFVPLDHPVLGKTTGDGSPIKFKKNETRDWKPSPLLGQDNRYVYTTLLGFTDSQLSSYEKKGIIV